MAITLAGLGIAALIGAGIGAGTAAAVGPEEEPLWKKLLIGGSLGAVAGAGLGAAAAPAAAAPAAGAGLGAGATAVPAAGVGAGTVLAPTVGTGAATTGTGLAATAPVVGEFGVLAPSVTASPLLSTSSGVLVPQAVNTSILTEGALASPGVLDVAAAGGAAPYTVSAGVAPAQTVAPSFGSQFMTGASKFGSAAGKFAVKHPLLTLGGVGAAGQLISNALEDGDDRHKDESFQGKASWEEEQSGSSDRRRSAFRGGVQDYNYTGAIGRRYF